MNINDINPFLRFVDRINFVPVKQNLRAADCHFFYMNDDCSPVIINGIRYDPSVGTVVIVPAGTDYYFLRDGYLRLISINFDYTRSAENRFESYAPVLAESFNDSDITERPAFEDHTFLNRPLVVENMGYLRPQIEEILKEFTCKKQFYREIASSNFKNIIFEVMRALLFDTKNSETVNTVLEYIHGHYSQDINNKSLSRAVGYHPYHLNRLMKNATGTTLHQYLIDCRISAAKRYLTESDISISEVAELCGYRNLCNFSSDFKKKAGTSPTKYREARRHMM